MKIRTRINSFTFLVFLPMMAILGAVLLWFGVGFLETELKDKLSVITVGRTNQVREFLTSQKEQVISLAASQVMRDFLSTKEESAQYNFQKQNTKARLVRTKEADEDIYNICLYDENGKVIASTDSDKENKDELANDSFQKGRAGIFIKDAHISKDGKNVLLYEIAAPINDDQTKEMVGVLSVSYLMSSEEFGELISDRQGLGETGEVFLINKEKYFLTPSLFLGNEVVLKEKVETENSRDCFSPEETEREISEIKEASHIGHEAVKNYVDYRGVKIFGSHGYIPETSWCLIAKIDQSELFKPIQSLVLVFIILLGVFVVLLSIAGNFFAKKISDPIVKLHHGTEVIEKGNLDYKVGVQTKDEIGQLSRSFDLMTESIKKSRQDIDKKVEEQTAKLLERQKDLEDQRLAIMNILEDVEKEKNKTEKLAGDLEKFKLAVDNASDHIVITDSEGIVLYGNKAVERVTGYKIEETLGKKAALLWKLPMPTEYYTELWDIIKNKKQIYKGEIKNKRKSGEPYDATISISPILNQKGEILFFVGIERDITEEKKSFEIAQKMAAIIQNTDDAVIGKDLNGLVTSWNGGATALYGYTEEEMMGKPIKILLPKDKQNEVDEILSRIKSDKKTEKMETVRIRKDGTEINVSITVSPIKDLKGEIIGAATIARDVTREKMIDRAKTEFVSLASHQLRTPLSAVNWYAEMMMSGDAGELNEEQKRYLKEIYAGNQRMVELVNALLNVSRIELGTFMVEPKLTDVVALSKSVIKELEPLIKQKQIKVTEMYDENLPDYSVDPKLLRIIIQNLLSNAVKYNNNGGAVFLTVGKKSAKSGFGGGVLPEDSLIIEVKDNGLGIPKSQHNLIYKKLFRADNVRESSTEGTGLGLYIVKSIIEQAGGHIWFESEEGKGSDFYVDLPWSGMKKKEGAKSLS